MDKFPWPCNDRESISVTKRTVVDSAAVFITSTEGIPSHPAFSASKDVVQASFSEG